MKKLFLVSLALLTLTAASFAQNTQPKKEQKMNAAPTQKTTMTTKSTTQAPVAHQTTKPVTANTNKQVTMTKKDGTPDMRYKANKEMPATKEQTQKKVMTEKKEGKK